MSTRLWRAVVGIDYAAGAAPSYLFRARSSTVSISAAGAASLPFSLFASDTGLDELIKRARQTGTTIERSPVATLVEHGRLLRDGRWRMRYTAPSADPDGARLRSVLHWDPSTGMVSIQARPACVVPFADFAGWSLALSAFAEIVREVARAG